MRLVGETKMITVEVTEKEYVFIKWCLDNADAIDIKTSGPRQPLNLSETPKKVKHNNTTNSIDKLPF